MPCSVSSITYQNITSAPGTTVKAWLDFQGLKSNPIEGIAINGIKLNGGSGRHSSNTCKLVKGTYKDCDACSSCEGLSPAE